MHHDLFVSYAREDAARVLALVEVLRARGYRVFVDVESLRLGEDWKRRLDFGIRGSRALLLCWSSAAAQSEFVRFEYAKAEARGKRILPWLLDDTPLPPMLELHGIESRDRDAVAAALTNALHIPLTRRRLLAGALTLLLGGGALAAWSLRSEPSFQFAGEVTDHRNLPLSGAIVTVNGISAITDADGRFQLTLPGAKPEFLRVRFRRDGFRDEAANASTEGLFRFAMTADAR